MTMPTPMVPHPLTETDLTERRDKLVALIHQLGTIEDEKKDTASDFAKQLKAIRAEIATLAREIRERQEYREAQMTVDDMLEARRVQMAQE